VKDNSWIDTFWGLTFIEPVVALIIMKAARGEVIPARTWLILGMVLCWGLRLALYIGLRHKVEDFRYQDMRKRWMEGGYCAYVTKAFFYIFMAQGIYSMICNAACLYVVIAGPDEALQWNDYVGLGVFLFGFICEVWGDMSLRAHLADQTPGKGKFCKRGLWRYSRHPNYFGEAVLWWGPYIVACSVYYGWTTFFAPLFIGLMVRFVSGVPLLENKYLSNPEF
jgi:steroid 5-alpha reductase family enzyme